MIFITLRLIYFLLFNVKKKRGGDWSGGEQFSTYYMNAVITLIHIEEKNLFP